MEVGVEGLGQADRGDRLGEHGEVADGILLGTERAAGHPAGRVVDAGHERGEREVGPEPAMATAVDLQELPFARHPLPAAAVLRRATRADGRQASLGQDPPERPLGDRDPLPLGQEFGQVGVVDPGIRRPGQLDEPGPPGVVESVGRRPAAVAVGERARILHVAGEQAADLAGREPEDPRRLLDRQAAGDDVLEYIATVLGPRVQLGLSVLGFHAPEGDKVTGRLARTESLAVHSSDRGG